MSSVQRPSVESVAATLPWLMGDENRVVAWRQGQPVRVATLLADVAWLAERLPAAPCAINVCQDRYAFLVAFCALLRSGQCNLMPSSRAPQAVAELLAANPGCHVIDDAAASIRQCREESSTSAGASNPLNNTAQIAAHRIAVVGHTSGSSGQPQAHGKTWASLHASSQGNLKLLQRELGPRFNIVATVPAQHMYGFETSVLLPLLGDIGCHSGQPLLPADIARALGEIAEPRLLVTTPVHLDALLRSNQPLPPLAGILSATAPLSAELARAAEDRYQAPLLEAFGSTETCVIASRRTARESEFTLYPHVHLHPQPDGTRVEAPQLSTPVLLADIVEMRDQRRFHLAGRNTDLLEIAGRRASLADLNRRLASIPGVVDSVVLQLDHCETSGVRRIAALAVAPHISETEILNALRNMIDPVFLPRPLRRVTHLPRNDTGKLPRAAALAMLKAH